MNYKSFSFSEVLGFGWRVMKANLWFFVGVGIVLFLIPLPGQVIGYLIEHHPEKVPPYVAFLWLPVALIVEIMLAVGLIKITLSFCDGEQPKLGMLFNAWDCFWRYLGANLLYGLIVTGATVVCILMPRLLSASIGIPRFGLFITAVFCILVVILLIKFSLCFYFVVDRGLGPVNALRASSRATNGAKWQLFVFGILCGLINLLGILCLVIGIFATFPTVMVATALVYRLLSAQTPELAEFGIASPDIRPAPIRPKPSSQSATEKRPGKFLLLASLMGLAVVIAASVTYCYLPGVKGVVMPNKDMKVSGIVYAEDKSSTVVNGQIAHEGDIIDGVKIVKIYRDKVEFERDDERWSQNIPAHPTDFGAGAASVTLLQLGSHKCPPCNRMMPILGELSDEYEGSLQVRSIDVWENPAAAKEYRVRKIPVQIFYNHKGKELFRHVGYLSKEDILAKWRQLGFNLAKTGS